MNLTPLEDKSPFDTGAGILAITPHKRRENNTMKNTKHSTTNYRALKPFLLAVDGNNGYGKFTAYGYMDLTIEWLGYTDIFGNPVYSMTHYGTLNGDLMAYPDMTFSIDDRTGRVIPLSYRNDYMGIDQEVFSGKMYSPRLLTELDAFLWQWGKNITAQGFTPSRYIKEA